MKRRHFGMLAGTSLAALKLGSVPAKAQTAQDPSLLKTTLTPFGSERAGNADGTIPAWTGGYTTVPEGFDPNGYNYIPDPFADEQPVVVIDSSNMSQYANKLSEGIMTLMTKYGFSIKVYPTHRTQAAPQEIYDNIAANVGRAQLDPAGGRLGFTGAFGGIPFPIPDVSDPYAAGAQLMWNHNSRWVGYAAHFVFHTWASYNGLITQQGQFNELQDYPYYKKGGSLASFNGIQFRLNSDIQGPPDQVGEQVMTWETTNPYSDPNIDWELLNGQGRVRKAPEISFDTPDGFQGGVMNYDEAFGFNASLEKYDWKYLEKKELYVPYNNNATYALTAQELMMAHHVNPDHVRWELHRVWVVEATLHPGERNVLARRRYYFDEDTSVMTCCDAWDANDELFHVAILGNYVRPDLPGTIFGFHMLWNLQTDAWAITDSYLNEKANPTFKFFDSLPDSDFDPQGMAAAGQY